MVKKSKSQKNKPQRIDPNPVIPTPIVSTAKNLVLTINGPFAYDLGKQDITIMAPMCAQHKGALSTIEKECPVTGNWLNRAPDSPAQSVIYSLEIKRNLTQKAKMPKAGPEFRTDAGVILTCPRPSNIDPTEWRFWVKVPIPDIYALVNPAQATVIKADKPQPAEKYTVGMQFIYTNWDGGPVKLIAPPGFGKTETFRFTDIGINTYNMDLKYVSPLREDPAHEDAVSCFETLMYGLTYDWSVRIPPYMQDRRREQTVLFTIGNDCHSPICWLEP